MSGSKCGKGGELNKMANTNKETGIAYGVVALNSLEDWVWDEFERNGRNLSRECGLEDYLKEHMPINDDGIADGGRRYDEDEMEAVKEELTEKFNSEYESGEEEYTLETNGMKLELHYLGGASLVWVIKSPHIEKCVPCSPCCPGAGDLDTKADSGIVTYDVPPSWYRKKE